ncbi:alpha-galactosidase [Mucilaginibacter pocheonensis]|uniref:Alpha-galactosidase n=1 Tax=Mucilaginibacter pocheonensis TaxID=398050 RepID=A0ABU1TER2_9SPHI|nr:alpha-galactosidase [Mucilaginibacter pocheonensis]MDR6943744.1 alpha-galactosidase [Mucilaginibacter pocheonensis]
MKSGCLNVYSGNRLILSQAVCTYKLNGNNNSVREIKTCRFQQRPVKDSFGKGIMTVITLSNSPAKTEQVFWTYPDKEFFFLQTRLIGKNLSTNDIVPLAGSLPQQQGDWRSLFVPFDNDTFISYDSKILKPPFRNMSSEVSVTYDDQTRNGLVIGSIEHELWKTGIETAWLADQTPGIKVRAGFTDAGITRDDMHHGLVRGDTICSPRIFIGYFDDWRSGMEDFAIASRKAEPAFVFNWTEATPLGWNSWGVMQDRINFDKAIGVANFFADTLKAFRLGGTAFIDLDSFWDKMVRNHTDFSRLKAFADSCLAKGLQPGIYWAPFTDWGWKSGPGRRAEGGDYTFGELWTKTLNGYHDIDGARALDPTHPGTLRRIDYFIDKFKACGFKMIKIDFLGHAAAESTHFHDTTVTTGMQAFRKGMEYLVNRLDGQMLIYAAISPSLATGRYAHSRRIACDAFKTIDHTHYTLNGVTYGWWQTYLYNYIDADHVVLDTEKDGVNRARFLSSVITGTCFTGDDFSLQGQWSARAQQLFQHPEILAVIKNGKAFRPLDCKPGKEAAEIFTRKIGAHYYVAIFNYGKPVKNYAIDFNRLGIPFKRAECTDLLTRGRSNAYSMLHVSLPGEDATLIRISQTQN